MADALIERFLEMMIAERDASQNTLSAYRRDLEEQYGPPQTNEEAEEKQGHGVQKHVKVTAMQQHPGEDSR